MAHTKRERVWEAVDFPVLETFEAVHPVLADVVSGQDQRVDAAIGWQGPGANVEDTPTLRSSVERVGVSPTRATVAYGRRVETGVGDVILVDSAGPLHRVELTTWRRDYGAKGTIVGFKVEGDDVDATHGFFNSAANRIDAAITRLKDPAPATHLTQPTPASGSQAEQVAIAPTGWRGRVSAVLRHPTGSAIVAGLVVAGIVALIALW